ncbi:unnamed protein product [Bursaphelenchus xylophilus]|uniref:(pine wood nematode) hypothetical protein n=1 Tax=Bursaphelenchus xylophilus TaxID=6326 RepID=A0A1I7SD12_BURXY|nr:unnamed protein product [Bursaphelenchus xylophilus]CAG9093112.1 unnamed protein product [Bursaphelenchus xylophilus]
MSSTPVRKGNRKQQEFDEIFTKFTALEGTSSFHKFVDNFVDNEIRQLEKPELFADLLLKALKSGGLASIPAFRGLLFLVLEKNFAVDNLYEEVYKLLRPTTVFSNQSQKLLELVGSSLSSPYLPQYTLAAFAKKLARLLLIAPVQQQLMILNVLKNICHTHPAIFDLLANRSEPATLASDPYDPEAPITESKASESSLWELKAIHHHWYIRVADRSKFIHGNRPEQRVKIVGEDVAEAILNKLKTDNAALNPKFGLKPLEATRDLICD